jgi:CRISPR/Cas system-associated exonuclease Cas4 (RecB family)
MQSPTPFQQSIMVQGTEVGKLARDLFPSGILINEDYKNLSGALEHTNAALQGNPEAIFEGAFIFDNVLIRVDILKRNVDGTFDLIEVKSSTSIKKEHLPDCAVQAYVLQNFGIKLQKICVMYLSSEYKRRGELDLSKLFFIEAVDTKIDDELKNVSEYLKAINNVLAKDEEPFWSIGSICNNPYTCEFKNYCWSDVNEKSIHSISRISDKQRQSLINNGIMLIADIPDDFKLTELQTVQVHCEKDQKRFVDSDAIKKHLAELQYPLYFLDFETYGYAIPQYEGTRPYQHLPFQYSLHVKQHPSAELEHHEFLFDKKENPSRSLAEHLIQHVGSTGSVIVYYASFEGSRIKEMATAFPDLASQLQSIHDHLWDLQTPFAKKWYCDPGFNGSASIKNVLPVLVPELSYSDLEIQKGDVAQLKYVELISLPEKSAERDEIKRALLEYCGLDTMAMVRILYELQKL